MRRFAVLLLAASLLAGCGASARKAQETSIPTVSHSRLVYVADHACGSFAREVASHELVRGYAPLERRLHRVLLPAYDRLLFKLRGLAPPASAAHSYRHLLAALNYQDLLLHHFSQAAGLGQIGVARRLVRRIRRLDRQITARAGRVGLRSCAKP